jgi:hypothetical protein
LEQVEQVDLQVPQFLVVVELKVEIQLLQQQQVQLLQQEEQKVEHLTVLAQYLQLVELDYQVDLEVVEQLLLILEDLILEELEMKVLFHRLKEILEDPEQVTLRVDLEEQEEPALTQVADVTDQD